MPSVRGHKAFADLQKSGRRASSGAIWVTFNADADTFPRLAFAINRSFGTAVVRNRVRRQVRAIMADLVVHEPHLMVPGDYLVGVRPLGLQADKSLDVTQAREWLIGALEQLAGQ